MNGRIRIFPATKYRAYDFATASGSRCVGLEFDGLNLDIALGDDAEVIGAITSLIDELGKLRHAAAGRIAAAELAELDAESPAEGHEVVAEWTRATA